MQTNGRIRIPVFIRIWIRRILSDPDSFGSEQFRIRIVTHPQRCFFTIFFFFNQSSLGLFNVHFFGFLKNQLENCLQGNTYIRQLDEDEIAGMRVACKLGREVITTTLQVDKQKNSENIGYEVSKYCERKKYNILANN